MKRTFNLLLFLFLGCGMLQAQHLVNGTVKDQSGAPLPGVNITERGTSNGTISDWDGMYTLKCSKPDAVLLFSYIGFADQEKQLSGQATLDVTMQEGITLQGVEIVGTRSQNRTLTNTMVPVDVIRIQDVVNRQGQLDINQLLQYAAPSFNASRQTGADGADHVDPASLRGLGPDQTLVLVNGKRRHQSSLVNIYGTRGRGNTGTDLNTIPAAAIERIEILRDGAAAQYGSDAIAGVINIVLKSTVEEGSANVNVGAHQAKDNPDRSTLDGENVQLNANYGFRIGKEGFVNMTADYWYRGYTNRYDPSLYRRKFGDAEGSNLNTWFNASLPLSGNVNLYAFGGSGQRRTNAYAWSRDAGSARNVDALYPNGFDPLIVSVINDNSLAAGIKGMLHGWNTDFCMTFGKNRFHYYGDNTLNASLEERSPTHFDDGGFQLSQQVNTLGFSRYFSDWLKGTNLAWGLEYRREQYSIFAGEEGSWKTYGPVIFSIENNGMDTIYRPGGAQGFPGFAPVNEVDESRTNLAAYVDAETSLSDAFDLGAALRFENYSDFGSTLNGKLSARYALTDNINARASFSTGFRAPSLPQIYFNSVYTDFVSGVAVDKFLARNNSPVTRALGIQPLQEEKSLSFGAGLTGNWKNLSASVDFYQIQIDDRIVLTGDFYNDDPEIGDVLRALNVGSARFFANAINTSTQGLDLVLSYRHRLNSNNSLNFTLSGNYNDMTIDRVNTSKLLEGKEDSYLSNRERLFILASAPKVRGNLSVDWTLNKTVVNVRLNYFDKITLEDYVGELDVYDPRTTLDLSVGIPLGSQVRWTLGGANILNAYPTRQNQETEGGGLYDAVQMGFNGAFYYTRLNFRF